MLSHSRGLKAFCGFLLTLPALASPAPSPLAKPMVCNADNCLRALRAATRNPATASAFCTGYISSSPGTVTVTSSAVTTITPAQITSTISEVTTTTIGPTDFTVTITPATVTVILNSGVQKRKRAVTTLPSYLTPGCNPTGTTSASARASSACSCLLTSATTTATAVSTVTAPALEPTTVYTSTSTVYIYTATVTSKAPAPTISTCVSHIFAKFIEIDDGPYAAAAGAFPIRSIRDKIECCNACYLGQNCYKFQFNDPALSPPGSDACILYQFTSAPTPADSRKPTATCPRGYGSIQEFKFRGGDYVGRTFEEGPCIDVQMK